VREREQESQLLYRENKNNDYNENK